MSRTLSIHTDDLLDDALRERAQTEGKTGPEMAREILSRALLGRRQRPLGRRGGDPQPGLRRPEEPAEVPPLNRREREHAWRRANPELLQGRYAGQWVVLEGEEIVAHGRSAVSAVEEARAKGVAVPYVFYVEPARPPGVVRMGL
jgi:hypothetical protein